MRDGIDSWAGRWDLCRDLGLQKLNLQYIDLIQIAKLAKEADGDITNPDDSWYTVYSNALEVNRLIRTIAVQVGYEVGDDKPPMQGPAIFL
jgi:hypothetical protein